MYQWRICFFHRSHFLVICVQKENLSFALYFLTNDLHFACNLIYHVNILTSNKNQEAIICCGYVESIYCLLIEIKSNFIDDDVKIIIKAKAN